MNNSEKKAEARRLRLEQRLTAGEIGRRLDIPKGTMSYWLHDIPLTKGEISRVLSTKATVWHAKHPRWVSSSGAKHSAAVGRGTKGRHRSVCPDSILALSSRTVTKILKRMGLGCSRCGWNKGICDIHHINGRKISDANGHWNLTYICPNCHRECHSAKMIFEFVPLEKQLGNNWKEYYYG